MGEYVGYLEVARRKCACVGNCEPPAALTPSSAVLMHGDANPGQEALAQCLADVCLLVDPDSEINYFSSSQNNELLDWEAEAYRQKLETYKED